MFNPREFFLPEELLPPKKQGSNRSFSATFALPQAIEIGKSSLKTRLEHHKEQIEEILNHLVRHQADKESLPDAIYELKDSKKGPSGY
ncbi:hypothetical protein Tco_0664182 [Tanacetum coccineum]